MFSVNIPILLRCVSLICANQPEPWDLRSMLGLGHTREACEFWQILENVRIVWKFSSPWFSMILHDIFSLSPFLGGLWLLLPEKTATYCTKWIARSGNCAIAPHVFRGCAQCCCFARFCQASRASFYSGISKWFGSGNHQATSRDSGSYMSGRWQAAHQRFLPRNPLKLLGAIQGAEIGFGCRRQSKHWVPLV